MASFLRKAARVNHVAMDFVLQVTVVELVLGALDSGRTLSFELSRGTKASPAESRHTAVASPFSFCCGPTKTQKTEP